MEEIGTQSSELCGLFRDFLLAYLFPCQTFEQVAHFIRKWTSEGSPDESLFALFLYWNSPFRGTVPFSVKISGISHAQLGYLSCRVYSFRSAIDRLNGWVGMHPSVRTILLSYEKNTLLPLSLRKILSLNPAGEKLLPPPDSTDGESSHVAFLRAYTGPIKRAFRD